MDYVYLGQTGVQVSALSFGTMSFGGIADEAMSERLFHRCRDAGINFFDCADLYVQGRSEIILGRLIKPCRDEVVLATKVYFPMGPDRNARGSSRYHIVRAVEASLRRLNTDRIDVYYLHRFDDHTALEETLRALDDLVRSGKILYPALSNFAAWQVMKALGIAERRNWAPAIGVQPMYNLVKRQVESEILPMAQSEKLAVMPYSPLGGGLLTGKYGVNKRPESGRIVDVDWYQHRYGDPLVYEIADRFVAFANEHGHHPVSLAVAWVQSHPAVTSTILGARNVDQLEPALNATEIEMTPDLRDAISALSPEPAPATDRNEERVIKP